MKLLVLNRNALANAVVAVGMSVIQIEQYVICAFEVDAIMKHNKYKSFGLSSTELICVATWRYCKWVPGWHQSWDLCKSVVRNFSLVVVE